MHIIPIILSFGKPEQSSVCTVLMMGRCGAPLAVQLYGEHPAEWVFTAPKAFCHNSYWSAKWQFKMGDCPPPRARLIWMPAEGSGGQRRAAYVLRQKSLCTATNFSYAPTTYDALRATCEYSPPSYASPAGP